jgi:hypothetical protein
MGGGSSKFCTGVLPPEMIARIDLSDRFSEADPIRRLLATYLRGCEGRQSINAR